MAGGKAQEGSPDQSPQGHPAPHGEPIPLLKLSSCLVDPVS
jgi:hypothetical protein